MIEVGEYGLENSIEGMYVRTTDGILGIIVNANSDELINGPEIRANEKIYCVERDSIKDIKENIIDLIEVGDYMNGKKVVSIREGGWGKQLVVLGNDRMVISNSDSIKTIATREQMAHIEYKVEADNEADI